MRDNSRQETTPADSALQPSQGSRGTPETMPLTVSQRPNWLGPLEHLYRELRWLLCDFPRKIK